MNRNVMITCALTGAGDTVGRSEHVPVTPEQIAESGIAAARAGATIVHVHVRDPETGKGSRDVALYREVVERIRASDVDVIVNTTAGMGGDLVLDPQRPHDVPRGHRPGAAASTGSPTSRSCSPTSARSTAAASTSARAAWSTSARRTCSARARRRSRSSASAARWRSSTPATCGSPTELVEEGLIDAPAMFQLCMGIPYGAPADPLTLAAMVNQLPEDAVWASFALGPMQMPWVAQSVLLGGHVRVGLEDNLYLSKGVKATNAQLVERARTIVESMGAHVATPDEGREILALKPTMSRPAPEDVRTVTCVGAGVIGGGWVAYFLARGYRVVAWDPRRGRRGPPAPPGRRGLAGADRARPRRGRQPRQPDASSPTWPRPAPQADFVQESAPEDLELKRTLLADIDAATPVDVVISSSTSGYGMSEMQAKCAHPERTVVGHPFNPPYLIPLVEVVGGTATSPEAVDVGLGLLPARRQVRDHHGPRGAGLHRQPAAGGAVARGAAHGRRR